MSRKSKPRTKRPADKLIKTTKKGDVELTEDELKRVSGGSVTIKFTTTVKNKVDTF
jgi:bacteriocin-like protein